MNSTHGYSVLLYRALREERVYSEDSSLSDYWISREEATRTMNAFEQGSLEPLYIPLRHSIAVAS